MKNYRLFLKDNSSILYLANYSTMRLCYKKKYPKLLPLKPSIYFTEDEIDKGSKLIEQLGLTNQDKWICIHNRYSSYLKNKIPSGDWSMHHHRNFSINSMKSASELFANQGYYVIRMGSVVDEKFITNNDKIIDYASCNFRSDLLDVYLLANCKFFFGSDSGVGIIPLTFQKPCYGINHFYTLLLIYKFLLFNFLRSLLILLDSLCLCSSLTLIYSSRRSIHLL